VPGLEIVVVVSDVEVNVTAVPFAVVPLYVLTLYA
jgi:hypothetical protein